MVLPGEYGVHLRDNILIFQGNPKWTCPSFGLWDQSAGWYHPLLRVAVQQALRQHPIPRSLGIGVRIAWRNALPSVAGIMDKHNLRVYHRDGKGGISVCESCVNVTCRYTRCSNCNFAPTLLCLKG